MKELSLKIAKNAIAIIGSALICAAAVFIGALAIKAAYYIFKFAWTLI